MTDADNNDFVWDVQVRLCIAKILEEVLGANNFPLDVPYKVEPEFDCDADHYVITCNFDSKNGDVVFLSFIFDSGQGGLGVWAETNDGFTFVGNEPSYSDVELSKKVASSEKVYNYDFDDIAWVLESTK